MIDSAALIPRSWHSFEGYLERGEAWRQLHHAARLVGHVGGLWGKPAKDMSHMALEWRPGPRALVGGKIAGPGGKSFRVGLRLDEPSLLLLDSSHSVLQHFDLLGRQLTEGRTWLFERAEKLAGESARNDLLRETRLDLHPVTAGSPFGAGCEDGFAGVERGYANADGMLRSLAEEIGQADVPVRCWPHHFDIAALFAYDADGEGRRTVGCGLSPAGDRCDRAYWYIGPYPSPEVANPPQLERGSWLTKGPLLAALPLADVAALSKDTQAAAVAEFFAVGIAQAREMLAKT